MLSCSPESLAIDSALVYCNLLLEMQVSCVLGLEGRADTAPPICHVMAGVRKKASPIRPLAICGIQESWRGGPNSEKASPALYQLQHTGEWSLHLVWASH